MHLYDTVFLVFFLPAFLGIYALLPAKIRPILIAAANLLFLAGTGKYSPVFFAAVLCCAYFSGITIYNLRGDPEKEHIRRKILAANVFLDIGAFVYCSVTSSGGLAGVLFDPGKIYCWAVIPLHLISYLTDVCRGDCEAATRISSLTAYAGFFPSSSLGPVMRYKCFSSSFHAPAMSLKKVSDGIKVYIFGLAEYLIIAGRLGAVKNEMLSAPDSLRSGTWWLYVPVFYFFFTVSIMGLVDMGRGVALMLGFNVMPPHKRYLPDESLYDRVFKMNEPLSLWFRDYVRKPLEKGRGKTSAAIAMVLCAGALWYHLSAEWIAVGLIIWVLGIIGDAVMAKRPGSVKAFRAALTVLLIIAAAVLCSFMELGSSAITLFSSPSTIDSSYTLHLLEEALIPVLFAAAVSGTVLPSLLRRLRRTGLRVLSPIVQIFLFIVSLSFMLNSF